MKMPQEKCCRFPRKVEVSKKPNFRITIRYEIPTFSSVGPFFEEGGEGV